MSVKLDTHVLDEMIAGHFAELGEAVEETAIQVAYEAKLRAPIDTGELWSSIKAEMVGKLKWIVSVGAEHGIFVELGTHKMKAQPFLTPAVEYQREAFIARIAAIINRR